MLEGGFVSTPAGFEGVASKTYIGLHRAYFWGECGMVNEVICEALSIEWAFLTDFTVAIAWWLGWLDWAGL